jgi:hypothetical protein
VSIEWAAVPDVADALGVEVTKVRQYLREGKLLAVRRDGDGPLVIPAAFVQDGAIVKHLPGVITLLRDARYADDEAIRWLFTDDDLPGSPIEALRANRGTEVKRRAQALGF